jgi:hypothetical protein
MNDLDVISLNKIISLIFHIFNNTLKFKKMFLNIHDLFRLNIYHGNGQIICYYGRNCVIML